MANSMRVRKAIEVVHYPVASADIIEIGDLLFYNGTSNAVESVADLAWNSDLATTQADLKGVFAGVAMSASAAGDTSDVRVATKGIADYPCASASFVVDSFIGVDDNATPDGLLAQQVITVGSAALAIGKPEEVQASVTIVRIRFFADIAGQPVG
jgi:hypothetical protein